MHQDSTAAATDNRPPRRARRLAWAALVFTLVCTIVVVLIPAWLIMPFKAQTSRGLALSYVLETWSPVVTAIAVVAVLALSVYLWRGARWFGRAAMLLALVPALATAWFARQNRFEWMFHPLTEPAFARVGEADFIEDNDMVLAVTIAGDAVAYPIRQMAYHHIVQDIVGGLEVVTTY